MNFVAINALRMMAVEGCLLGAAFLACFLCLKFLHRSPWRPQWLRWILDRNSRSVLFVITVALLARALLLPAVGVPEPHINDEYGYLLMADTFSHHRLTNPTPLAWPHFETFHVNMTPTYHSKYPVAQGLVLAFGEMFFHQPWAGVYLSTALMCGAICWALQAFFPPVWALLGGLLAVVRMALFSYWMNSYWGGSVAALGGAVALGAVVRLFQHGRTSRSRVMLACLFGLALLVLATSRPYEGFAFSIPLLAYFAYRAVRSAAKREANLRTTALPVVLIGLVGITLMGYYNKTTTGSPFLLPYVLYQRTYPDLPFALPLLVNHKPRPELPARDPVFAKWYAVLAEEHGYAQTKTLPGMMGLEAGRLGIDWFFYVGPALTIPVLTGFVSCIRQPRLRIAVAITLTTGAAIAICLVSQPHYFSPATVAVYLFAVEGLYYLWQEPGTGARAFVLAVCLTTVIAALTRQTGSAGMYQTFSFPDTRKTIAADLERKPGKHLVLVSYDMDRHYPGDELVHNGADFRSAKVLWARSKGAGKDADLCRAYPDRIFWSLTTDDVNVSFQPLDLCPQP